MFVYRDSINKLIWRDRYKIYFVFDRDDLQWIAAMDL